MRAALRLVLGAIPTLLILALIGVAGWWGHHSGWTLPRFSALRGDVPVADDWCPEHNVPESVCVGCRPGLRPRTKGPGWCQVHGAHECPLCRPELAQTATTPTVTPADRDRAAKSLAFADRPTNNPICKLHERRIQFGDIAAFEKSGVDVEPVWTGGMVEAVAAPGEVVYDQTRVAHVSARAAGTVWKVFKHIGEAVKAGEVVALVDAKEVGRSKADLLQAVATRNLNTQVLAGLKESGGAVPAARVREAEAAVREAEIRLAAARQTLVILGLPLDADELRQLTDDRLEARLHFLGLPDDQAKSLDPRTTTSNLLPVVARMAGVVTSREVVAGEAADTARILFELVDPANLWINFDVAVEDARRMKLGLPVRFRTDGGKEELTGTVTWVSTQADPRTRTVKVRADLPNPYGRQRANTFGAGRIVLRDAADVVAVPNGAVHWEGCCHVVFVRDRSFLAGGAPRCSTPAPCGSAGRTRRTPR